MSPYLYVNVEELLAVHSLQLETIILFPSSAKAWRPINADDMKVKCDISHCPFMIAYRGI